MHKVNIAHFSNPLNVSDHLFVDAGQRAGESRTEQGVNDDVCGVIELVIKKIFPLFQRAAF